MSLTLMPKGTPRKPSQPLGYIGFPKSGPAYKVVEELPHSKEDLEASIVRKFVGALTQFEDRSIVGPERGDEWPDFECRESNGRIGIELVEVIDARLAQDTARRAEYLAQLLQLLEHVLPRLPGIEVLLDDNYQEPNYPPVASRDGRKLVGFIAENIGSCAEDLEQLSDRLYGRKWLEGRSSPKVGLFAWRYAPANPQNPARIGFSAAVLAPPDASQFLARALEEKVAKNYANYPDGRLILLAYETMFSSVLMEAPESLEAARSLLISRGHPFDEVWYAFPYADEDTGHIERVWPVP